VIQVDMGLRRNPLVEYVRAAYDPAKTDPSTLLSHLRATTCPEAQWLSTPVIFSDEAPQNGALVVDRMK